MSEQKGTEQKQLTAIDRLEALEKEMAKIANLGKVLQAVATQLQRTTGSVQALGGNLDGVYKRLLALETVLSESETLSPNSVDNKMAAMEAARREQQEENLVKQGLLSENVEGVSAESYVVIRQLDKATGQVEVLREHVDMSHVESALKDLFLGKKVGDKIELDGKELEVLRVLDPVKEGSLSAEESKG
jgi:hypothetical protein